MGDNILGISSIALAVFVLSCGFCVFKSGLRSARKEITSQALIAEVLQKSVGDDGVHSYEEQEKLARDLGYLGHISKNVKHLPVSLSCSRGGAIYLSQGREWCQKIKPSLLEKYLQNNHEKH